MLIEHPFMKEKLCSRNQSYKINDFPLDLELVHTIWIY